MPTFPYLARATTKYKSPHKQDLTFAKRETIRVTGVAPKTDTADDEDDDDDDDWLVGETLDGSKSGIFPGSFVEPLDDIEEPSSHEADVKIASAISAPAAAGAIPTEAPTDLQRSVVEEQPPSYQAQVIPEAARETAQKAETEQAGFGAPLPPRPPSPDEEDDDQNQEASDPHTRAAEAPTEEAAYDSAKGTRGTSEAAGGAAIGGAAAGAAAAVEAKGESDASKLEAAQTVAATEAKAVASPPTKSPPAVASKPAGMSSSFRDRLAAFNKPAESAPPPLPKAKLGGWKRPTPVSTEAKPLLPGAPTSASATAVFKSTPVAQQSENSPSPTSPQASGAGGAFSAADAQTSIKMSLKERMAALQRNEAAAADSAPQIKPKPAIPGKIGADRRNVALQGMGLAPGAQIPARNSSFESGRSTDEPVAETTAAQEVSASRNAAAVAQDVDGEIKDAPPVETGAVEESQEQLKDPDEPKETLTEEEQEAERRAAIAKRMAALGARRMGGGSVPFGAPAPPSRTKTASSVESAEGTTSEPGITVSSETPRAANDEEPADAAALTDTINAAAESSCSDVLSPTSAETVEAPKVLAVPRRAAAPRKRKAAAQTAAAAGIAAVAQESEAAAPPTELESEKDLLEAAADGAGSAPVVATAEEATSLTDEKADATPGQSAELHHDQDSNDVAKLQNEVEPQLDESDPEIAENQRQLEEYLRGEGFYEDQVEPAAQNVPELSAAASGVEAEAPAAEAELEQPPAIEDVPSDNAASLKPPSRPPSARPPIPKTNVPPPPVTADHDDAVAARAQSPSASAASTSMSPHESVIPPVPTSTLSTPMEDAANEVDEPEPPADEVEDVAGPVLAAPKPRVAIPTEDPEDEELLAAADTTSAANARDQASGAAAYDQFEEQELTQEEQEAQRRANLARRMAALGGQRIGAFPGMTPPPIMGAPMPARKAPIHAAEEIEEQSRDVNDVVEQPDQSVALSPRGPPRGGMAIPGLTAVPSMDAQHAEVAALERARSPDAATNAPARLASPPPVPTSPPPKPLSPPPPIRSVPTVGADSTLPPMLPPGRPSSTVPMPNLDEAIRSASPASSSLGRRTSMKPPVPQGISAHSRASSAAVVEQELAQDRNSATSPPPMPISPPPLPVSPPPRPSSRAPPLPGSAGVPPRRQGSSASYTSTEAIGQSDAPAVPSAATTLAPSVPGRTEASLPPTPASFGAPSSVNVGARQSSRDLDLMPSSRWWRHGLNPLRLPPTVAGRPDAILYADTSSSTDSGVVVHRADVHMLFEDYSTTVISLSFQDDDLEETHTTLSQRHNFAPPKPSSAELKQWSSSIGAEIGRLATEAAKQSSAPLGDGSPQGFVHHIISSVASLPPVGTSLGALILTQVGPTVVETGADEPRAGDIVLCSNADFRGKKGLAPYHTTLGSSLPIPAILVDMEPKKNKLRCILQNPSHSKKHHPEEISLRLDDLKSGILKIYRSPPRHGWLPHW